MELRRLFLARCFAALNAIEQTGNSAERAPRPGRARHIDIAKGISITLVVMFHSQLKTFFPEIIEPMALFRMPLFFLLSGIFFTWVAIPRDFLFKKFEALLKPYFSVLLTLLFISVLAGGDALGAQLQGILYGNGGTIKWVPMWFLTHLFAVYVFSYLLFRYTGINKLKAGIPILITVFLIIGSLWIEFFWHRELHLFSAVMELPGLPFSLDILLITSAYFMLGCFLKSSLIGFRPLLSLFILSVTAFLIVSQYTNAHIDLNERVYASPVYATLGALCGIYIILSLAHFIAKSDWLSFLPLRLGQASLYILIFHAVIMNKSFKILANGVTNDTYLIVLAFATFALGVIAPLFIKRLVEKNDLLALAFLPFASNKLAQLSINKGMRAIGKAQSLPGFKVFMKPRLINRST